MYTDQTASAASLYKLTACIHRGWSRK